MLIQEMTRQACLDFLARHKLGRLACSREGQPYITPLYFAHQDAHLYSFSTIGQKIEWMRGNPLVCVEADEVESPQKWSTVIVFGRYEELPKTPECEAARQLAYSLLQGRPQWWEPGYAKTILGGKERELELVYFRIYITHISGHRASPETSTGQHA
ncbi:MAG TPA: pyridoxamine 5'-phosphate oxidase family protein [Micropepsaceae bacterium]|nr:pyridoxamine 5'-phosphate oxidase family protein [Micropepsaceae bacterium]